MSQPTSDARLRVLLADDCLDVLRSLPDGSVDAVVTDPPAGISFMGRAWDGDRGGREQWVAWLAERLAECLRVCKPGAHAVVWALPRTSYWTGLALDEAGWEVRDVITHLFGEGFPKSLDVSKAIDKRLGAERTEVIGHKDSGLDKGSGNSVDFSEASGRDETGLIPVTAPATAAAAAAAGGWGTGLKPACEFWFLARKPLAGTVAENFMAHGVGALNLAGCEVGTEGGTKLVRPKESATGRESTSYGASIGAGPGGSEPSGGRWPANVVLSHDPRCEGSGSRNTDVLCVEDCPVRMLNEQSGESSSSSSSLPLPRAPGDARGEAHGDRAEATVRGHDDRGGAARFFYVAKPRTREKIGGAIRNLHPTAKGIDLMRYLVRLVTPPDGVVLDPFAGSGTTGCACVLEGVRFVGIERDADSHATALARISDYAFASGIARPAAS